MKHYALMALALLLLSTPGFAQETTGQATNTTIQRKTYQPDVRGSLLLGVALNALVNEPGQFEISNWRSKSVNLYYLYDINLGSSRFSFHPGIGLGLEKYEIESGATLAYGQVAGATEDVLFMEALGVRYPDMQIRKNRLAANYVDVPLELSWVSNKTNPKAGFKASIGGKVGILYDSFMKIKYSVGDETRKDKLKRDWNLSPFRYAALARVGYSSFNLYFEYQFSNLFDAGEGPLYRPDPQVNAYERFPGDMTNWRIGLALDLF